MKAENEKLVAATTQNEHELEEAHTEIARLKEELRETTKSLNTANGRYEQAQRHLEIAEQLARDEQASRAAMEKGESIDSASLQEEKQRATEAITQLREQIRAMEEKALEESESLSTKVLEGQSRATRIQSELNKTVAMHKTSLVELNDRHREELDRVQEELNGVSLELGSVQDQLRSSKMETFELMVAKDDAVTSMEKAVERAQSAETKLKEMTEFIKSAESLKKSNERLHVSLQDEAGKRKMLHNKLEDLKGRIRVYVRVRPLSETEMNANYENVMTKEDERTCVMAVMLPQR